MNKNSAFKMLKDVFSFPNQKSRWKKITNINLFTFYQNVCILDFQLGKPITVSSEFRNKENTSNQKNFSSCKNYRD